jgi:hypothetical protein
MTDSTSHVTIRTLLLVVFLSAALWQNASALDFYFTPDTSRGNIGDTVLVHGYIGTSEMLRGFTVYMYYDTNTFDLASAPVAGTLIAGRSGLDFRYSDHIIAAPGQLEVGATVFSTSYWAGPGELFRAKFVLRHCTGAEVYGDAAFRSSTGVFIQGTYNPPAILVCDQTPQPPLPPAALTVAYDSTSGIVLHWSAVRYDLYYRPLQVAPSYNLFRQSIRPGPGPVELIATTGDTLHYEPLDSGFEYTYWITAQTP